MPYVRICSLIKDPRVQGKRAAAAAAAHPYTVNAKVY